MRSENFLGWMLAEGLSEDTARARLANCRTVENYQQVNLDEQYDGDRCEHLIALFTYTTDDERVGRPALHHVPINGNVRNGSATYKASIGKYVAFRDSENEFAQDIRPQQRRGLRGRRIVRAHDADPNRESYQEFFEAFGIMPQAVCDFGMDHSVFAEQMVALAQWHELKDDLLNGRRLHIRADRGNEREFLFYKRLNEYLFQNDALAPDYNGNYYPRRNLERAVGWEVTIHPEGDTGVLVNYQTSHVLSGRTHNPLLYSAIWNIVFTPKIIDPFTGDEAHGPAALLFREAFMNSIRARFAECIEDFNDFINVHNIGNRINDFHHEDFADEVELIRLKEAACRQWAAV